jgi:hypothetical protein
VPVTAFVAAPVRTIKPGFESSEIAPGDGIVVPENVMRPLW